MAGHSKFKNIMHRKGAQDARRAKKFARLTKELQVAVRGGTDPSSNPRLRSALSACRAVNMPKDNIERVIKKAEWKEVLKPHNIHYLNIRGWLLGCVHDTNYVCHCRKCL